MAPANQAKAREQRRTILEAAARFIAENGYHGMTMRALAKATGRSLASAYNYFSSKEEILYALQREAFEALITAAERATAEADSASSRLHLFILNHLAYCTEHPDVMRVLVHEAGSLPATRRRAVRRLKRRYFEIGHGVVEAVLAEGCGQLGAGGRPAGEPADPVEVERIAYSLFGMLNWIYSWYEPQRHGDVPTLARTMHHLLLCGAVASCPAAGVHAEAERGFERLEAPPLLSGRRAGAAREARR